MIVIQSERLILRHFRPEDAPFMLQLVNSPGWIAFIGDRGIRDEAAAEKMIRESFMATYEKEGYGLYMVERRSDNQAMGMCGLVNRPGLDSPDIGFALLGEFEGHGYAFESSELVLNYARETLNLPKVVAITSPKNLRCHRLLERLGFESRGEITLPQDKRPTLLFEPIP